jgi:endoglucanase
MHKFEGFVAGANLGGWISQYGQHRKAHFDTFIAESDIRQIAAWGMDHVRLPFDFPILEDDARPYEYKESGLAYLDNCLAWCRNAGLNLILDMHKAPGYSFDAFSEANLFANPELQERFFRLWEMLALRYKGQDQPVLVFELMNEVVLPNSDPWNALAKQAFARIRAIDPNRWVMIGGNHYNSASTLREIDLIDDPHVVYTFHFYEPMPFTHQKAQWVEELIKLNTVTEFPSKVPHLYEFLEKNPQYARSLGKFMSTAMDKDYLRAMLQPAVEFQSQTGLPLYCGEYGAIDHAPLQSRLRWHRDFVALLRENNIGRAVWSYKLMNFRLVDGGSRVASEELVKLVSAR